jgi:hypothetical protein
VRVRLFELRLLALTLSVLWAAGGGIVLIGYRPGGPWDVAVGVSAILPFLVSVTAIVWPPLVTSSRASAVIFWIGAVAGLLLIPSIAGVAAPVVARRSQPVLPSLEVVYPWILALLATTFFAGLGMSRRLIPEIGLGRRRLAASIAFALLTTGLIATTFAGVSLADDAALSDQPAAYSRFGPTSPRLTPPSCDGPLEPAWSASLDLSLWGDVDGDSIGSVDLAGERVGEDFSWTARVVRSDLFGQYGAARIGARAWTLSPGQGWRAAAPASLDSDQLDATALEKALASGNRATAEDRGLEYVEGARARHCRAAVDGPTFGDSFPQVVWLIRDASLATWRGEVDYWVFGDGEVGMIAGSVNGNAQAILPHGILATLNVRLTATNRDTAMAIAAP